MWVRICVVWLWARIAYCPRRGRWRGARKPLTPGFFVVGSCSPHLPRTHPSCARAPRRGGGGYPSAEWKAGPWGVFSAVAASSLGCVCGRLKHAPIHLAWNYQLSCQIDLAHCSVTAHHMKHAPINLAWNYQLSRHLARIKSTSQSSKPQ